MDTKVYSVFPACGKTWLYEHQDEYGLKILDSDSSQFSWKYEESWERDAEKGSVPVINKVRNPAFPNNYIAHIKDTLETGLYDYIFVSSHESVRKALNDAGIDFTIVYPSRDCLEEWIGRCYLRELNGKNGFPIKVLIDNWKNWIYECEIEGIDHDVMILEHCEYLSDYFDKTND